MARRYRRFADFYPVYLAMHSDPRCRRLHLVGNLLGAAALILAVVTRSPWALAASPVLANACAWVGHLRFQRNRPGVWSYPLFGLLGSWMMTKDVLVGRLDW